MKTSEGGVVKLSLPVDSVKTEKVELDSSSSTGSCSSFIFTGCSLFFLLRVLQSRVFSDWRAAGCPLFYTALLQKEGGRMS